VRNIRQEAKACSSDIIENGKAHWLETLKLLILIMIDFNIDKLWENPVPAAAVRQTEQTLFIGNGR